MRKIFVAVVLVGLTAMWSIAATDSKARDSISDIQKGRDNRNRIEDLLVNDDATIRGGVTVSEDVVLGVTSMNVTNLATVTLSNSVFILTGTGGANDTTNTITLANATQSGQFVTIMAGAATTNLIGIADSGLVRCLNGNWVGDAGDTLRLMSYSTTNWVELGRSDN